MKPAGYNHPLLTVLARQLRSVTGQNHDLESVVSNNIQSWIDSADSNRNTPDDSSRQGAPETFRSESSQNENSETAATGRIISWLERTADGAIVMGNLYPPGEFVLVKRPNQDSTTNPDERMGDEITGTPVGRFAVHADGSVSFAEPSSAGIYFIVEQTGESL